MTVTIRHGDCREVLRTLPDESVHCCVTSPPYFGLRDYGVAGQIGLEPTPYEFVLELVAVFREVRRVLRNDGTLWLNLGDSYAGSGRGGNPTADTSTLQGSLTSQEASKIKRGRDEVGATARQAAVTRRGSRLPCGFHEEARQSGAIGRAWVPPPSGLKQKDLIGTPWMVAFALRSDGWYLRQDIIWSKPNPMPESVQDRCTKSHEYLFLLSKSSRYFYDASAIREDDLGTDHPRNELHKPEPSGGLLPPHQGIRRATGRNGEGRNKRSVWHVATNPFPESHFATFPPALIEPCIKAGSPAGGIVLDPFGGAGTTGMVADRLGRDAILIELNPDYAAMAERRVRADGRMFADVCFNAPAKKD